MPAELRLALNPDTTPLATADVLVFKSCAERVREAAEAGFEAVNVDPGEERLTVQQAREILDRHGLVPASGFFHDCFENADRQAAILERASRHADFAAALGQDCLFACGFVSPPERLAVAGRMTEGDGPVLNDRQWHQFAATLHKIALIWKEQGITLCYHPHVATYVESLQEIERLLEVTDPELIKLGPDTGHLFYGGSEPLATIEDCLERVAAIHIKDVRFDVVQDVRRLGLGYREACARGVWTEIGRGDIDFPAFFSMLREHDWGGWVIVETDHTEFPTALESSQTSRQYLREIIGI